MLTTKVPLAPLNEQSIMKEPQKVLVLTKGQVCLQDEATLDAYVQHSRASLCLVIHPIESWVHIDHHEYH